MVVQSDSGTEGKAMAKFESGKTYEGRGLDAHAVVRFTVASRTDHTITTTEGKRMAISVRDGVEAVKPWGSNVRAPRVLARTIA